MHGISIPCLAIFGIALIGSRLVEAETLLRHLVLRALAADAHSAVDRSERNGYALIGAQSARRAQTRGVDGANTRNPEGERTVPDAVSFSIRYATSAATRTGASILIRRPFSRSAEA